MHERDLWRVARASRARDPSRPRSRRASTRARPRVSARDCVHAIDRHARDGRSSDARLLGPRDATRSPSSLPLPRNAGFRYQRARAGQGTSRLTLARLASASDRASPTAETRVTPRTEGFFPAIASLFRPTRVWNAPVFAANATHRITLTDVIRRRARFRVVTRDFFFWLCISEIFPRRDRRLTSAPSHSIHHSRPSRAAPLALRRRARPPRLASRR